jgi:hypothetical protein
VSDRIGGFSPDIGLEYIARHQGETPNLPPQSEAKLTGGPIRQQLNELFGGPSLEQTLQRFISPHPNNPAILAPTQFASLVQESAQYLREQAERSNNPLLQSASALLDQEEELRQLFSYYRSSLQGV